MAATAILFGVAGILPLLLELGLPAPAFVRDAISFGEQSVRIAVVGVVALLVAPTLLLWGLIAFQQTSRGRSGVTVGAIVVCLCTAPFGIGLVLCLPIFFCVILPIMRQFKAAGGTPPFEQA
ncbi:hypothetical protein [Falsiroseomonas sp.]|uniref:hypothetical protein n=1 Tax=Falsiroseomonas sp. TaxID=2870721 RepID=UPI003566FD80